MKAKRLQIRDIILLTPFKNQDDRGFFSETYNQTAYQQVGIQECFVQDNHSVSAPAHVLRGLHFQKPPFAQGKLIRVTHGSILDVAVDIRHGSATFGQHVSAILSAENWNQLWVPEGFAHGFCTLEKNTQVIYKVTNYYSQENDVGIAYNDPDLAINWNLPPNTAPILSKRDQQHQTLAALPKYFNQQFRH